MWRSERKASKLRSDEGTQPTKLRAEAADSRRFRNQGPRAAWDFRGWSPAYIFSASVVVTQDPDSSEPRSGI